MNGNNEAIALLKAFLSLFRSDMGEVLEAVAFKILQIQEWLEETHVGCVRQLEFCQGAILQAHAHDSPDDALSDAYDQLKEAQEQFDNFLSWKQQIEEAIFEYQQQAVLMKAQLDDDVTRAEFFLEEIVAKLKEYFAVSPSTLGGTATVIPIGRNTTSGTAKKGQQKEIFENFAVPSEEPGDRLFGSHRGICSGRPFFSRKIEITLAETLYRRS